MLVCFIASQDASCRNQGRHVRSVLIKKWWKESLQYWFLSLVIIQVISFSKSMWPGVFILFLFRVSQSIGKGKKLHRKWYFSSSSIINSAGVTNEVTRIHVLISSILIENVRNVLCETSRLYLNKSGNLTPIFALIFLLDRIVSS